MADIFTKKKRSEVMSHIRGRGNKKTELAMIRFFKENQISGWRRNQKVYGRPDFVFWEKRIALFVDGCFWHGCPLHYIKPVNNSDFWQEKFVLNNQRDQLVDKELLKRNWTVIRVWEHELLLKKRSNLLKRLKDKYPILFSSLLQG